jgi:predicted transcriptional regulator
MGNDRRKPFCLRLSPDLTERVDECAERLRKSGLPVSRTALDSVHCNAEVLLRGESQGGTA